MAGIDLSSDSTPPANAVRRSTWWREVLIIAGFYGLYTLVRDLRGTKPVSVAQALTNAHRVIHLERWLGLFHEADIQHRFLGDTWLVKLCDDFYGTVHFLAPITVLVLLFFWYPSRYRFWRNTLALVTGLALVGFYFFPLMPPRLLTGYHFEDTLRVVGGLWDFNNGPVDKVSNQYAAMPSLHTAWSAWCAASLWGIVERWWARLLLLVLPAFTVFAIVVTANHYFLDAAAGLMLVGVSYLAAKPLTYATRRVVPHRRASLAETTTLERV